MYVLYEKATNRVIRASISDRWEDVSFNLDNPGLYGGISVAYDVNVIEMPFRYEVKWSSEIDPIPYLVRHSLFTIRCEGAWTIGRNSQKLICENQKTKFIIHFEDEEGKPIKVSGDLNLETSGLYLSDAHITLNEQSEVIIYITGRVPCRTSIDILLSPSNCVFFVPETDTDTVVRATCELSVVSRRTFLKWSDDNYYNLEILASDGDGDGVKDILADGACIATCTIRKKNSAGEVVSDNDVVRITTTYGRLTREQLRLANGVGTFAIQSNTQTVTAQIRVEAIEENNGTIYGIDEIHFRLVREA